MIVTDENIKPEGSLKTLRVYNYYPRVKLKNVYPSYSY